MTRLLWFVAGAVFCKACAVGLERLARSIEASGAGEDMDLEADVWFADGPVDAQSLIGDMEAVVRRLGVYLDREPCDLIDEGQLMLLSNAHRRVAQVLVELRRPRAVAS